MNQSKLMVIDPSATQWQLMPAHPPSDVQTRLYSFLIAAVLAAGIPQTLAAAIGTLAGTGSPGYAGDSGPATKAQLNNPYGLCQGPDKALYICDMGNHVIRKIDHDGKISTVAGTGEQGYSGDGGPAVKAKMGEPYEIRFDRDGNIFFVDMQNNVVRRIDAGTQTISTVAGIGQPGFSGDEGPATKAALKQPHSIQLDGKGGLFICDIGNQRVRKVDLSSGTISTFAGTGVPGKMTNGAPRLTAPLNGPRTLDFDAQGDLWLALREGNAIYRMDARSERFFHVAGTGQKGFAGNGGPAAAATLSGPKGLSIAPNGNVYLADTESHSIRMIDVRSGLIHLIAGTGEQGAGPDGDPLGCKMSRPHGIYAALDGTIFIGDSEAHVVRVIPARR